MPMAAGEPQPLPPPPPPPPSALSAASSCMRGFVMPLRLSVMARPVSLSAVKTCVTVAVGSFDFITAHAPATCGVAMDVPWKFAKPPPGTDERITLPGGSRFSMLALFEKEEMVSAAPDPLPSLTEPTLTAEEMHAGPDIALE